MVSLALGRKKAPEAVVEQQPIIEGQSSQPGGAVHHAPTSVETVWYAILHDDQVNPQARIVSELEARLEALTIHINQLRSRLTFDFAERPSEPAVLKSWSDALRSLKGEIEQAEQARATMQAKIQVEENTLYYLVEAAWQRRLLAADRIVEASIVDYNALIQVKRDEIKEIERLRDTHTSYNNEGRNLLVMVSNGPLAKFRQRCLRR